MVALQTVPTTATPPTVVPLDAWPASSGTTPRERTLDGRHALGVRRH